MGLKEDPPDNYNIIFIKIQVLLPALPLIPPLILFAIGGNPGLGAVCLVYGALCWG